MSPIYQKPNMVKLDGAYRCPRCSTKLDGATSIDGAPKRPNEGDFSLCIHCGLVLRFQSDHLEPVTIEEIALLDDETRHSIERVGRGLGFSVLGLVKGKGPGA